MLSLLRSEAHLNKHPKTYDHYLYHNQSTGKWHEMIVWEIVRPSHKRKLFADQDMRKAVIVMTYLEDPSNTRMYFYWEDVKGDFFKKADEDWRPV
jgi:hypothetical protein